MTRRFIDLTLPLYDWMPVGNVWAWDVPFQTEPIVTIEKNGFELFKITMFSETGTRLMIPRMQHADAPTVDKINHEELMLRQTVVVDLPKGSEEEISEQEIRDALEGVDFPCGSALLVRTGWGDDERWEKIGDDYARNTPHWSPEAAVYVCDWLIERNSNLILSDVAYYGRGEKYVLPLWGSKPAWERPPFPSIEAKRFLAEYDRTKSEEDWDSPPIFNKKGIMFVGACCNCNQITKDKVDIIVVPMKIKGAAGASCNVIAIEE